MHAEAAAYELLREPGIEPDHDPVGTPKSDPRLGDLAQDDAAGACRLAIRDPCLELEPVLAW